MSTYQSHSEEETIRIAEQFMAKLSGGAVVALRGELGSGKTVFAKGLAQALNVNQIVTSPTFVLMKVYQGKKNGQRMQLAHLDCYRLTDSAALLDIGVADYLGQSDCITVIEWPERVPELLPSNTWWCDFSAGTKPTERQIIIQQSL